MYIWYQSSSEQGLYTQRQCCHRYRALHACRAVASSAHKKWAAWAATALGRELQLAMAGDAALVSAVPLRTWEETVITQVSSPVDCAWPMPNAKLAGMAPTSALLEEPHLISFVTQSRAFAWKASHARHTCVILRPREPQPALDSIASCCR